MEPAPPESAPHSRPMSPAPAYQWDVWKSRLETIQAFVIANFLPLIFIVAIIWALAWPEPGQAVLSVMILGDVHLIQEINIVIVFFISGLALSTAEMKQIKGSTWSVVYGAASILLLTPLLGFAMRQIPLQPSAFSIGLVVFCVAPTTLGAGVALVRACKGNEAIALLLTVGTNMLGVVTMPPMLMFLFLGYDMDAAGLAMNLDIADLFVKLLISVFVPSIVGKGLRDLCKPVQRFAQAHKVPLGLFSTANLAFIVWQTLSGAQPVLLSCEGSMIAAVIAISSSIFFFYLLLNYVVVFKVFRGVPLPEAVSIVIMASQKSAPVAVTVISYISSDAASQGLMAIPAIIGQLMQIFAASFMAPFIARKITAWHKQKQAQEEDEARMASMAGLAGLTDGGASASHAMHDRGVVPVVPTGAQAQDPGRPGESSNAIHHVV